MTFFSVKYNPLYDFTDACMFFRYLSTGFNTLSIPKSNSFRQFGVTLYYGKENMHVTRAQVLLTVVSY